MSHQRIHIFQLATNRVCAPYRFEFPANLLRRLPDIEISTLYKLDREAYQRIVNEADILIVQRLPMSSTFAKVCGALRSMGKLVVFEIDDNLMHLPPYSRYAQKAPADYSERIKQSIALCDAVQCSTEALARVLREFQPEVAVLENQLESVLPFQNERVDGKIVICYAAGEDHWHDWLTIKDAYNETILDLTSAGYELHTWIIGDEAIFDTVQGTHKRFFPLLSRRAYLDTLSKVDIALVPLVDNSFNQCKSDIKYLEATACSAAVLASHVVYSGTISEGETGLLFASTEDFAKQLRALISNRQLRHSLARKAHRCVSETRLIRHHISKWSKAYRDWHADRVRLLSRSVV